MNYRSIAQLSDQILSWSATLPKHFDLIVGVPRSGMLAANLLALYRNIPFTDVEGLFEGRIIATGRRFNGDGRKDPFTDRLKVLIVDDSVWGGTTMRDLKQKVSAASLPHEIYYGAVYVRPGTERIVDYYCEVLDLPRIFEWNILQSRRLANFCVDIDGVLCPQPTREVRQDTARYEEFLACVDPLHLPTKKVGWLVTSRADRYRALTEEWLAKHGVEYGELVMMETAEKEAGRGVRASGAFKAEVYMGTRAELFIESSLTQSIQIANLSLRPVFCVDTMQMVYPGNLPQDRLTAPSASGLWRRVDALRRRLRMQLKVLGFVP